jgi:hypothetical protein
MPMLLFYIEDFGDPNAVTPGPKGMKVNYGDGGLKKLDGKNGAFRLDNKKRKGNRPPRFEGKKYA